MYEKDLLDSLKNPDNQLVAEAQAGDMAAEETLIRKYSYIVSRKAKAFYMVGADTDDIMQEGMIGLLKAVRKYEPDKNASFATFAEICVTTQMISAIRGSRRNKNKPLNTSVSLNEPESEGISLGETLEANAADTPEEMLVFKDVIYYILNNGDKIFSDFEMRVINEAVKGYSRVQIAEKFGKTPKAIDNALQRAKKKIKDYLWL